MTQGASSKIGVPTRRAGVRGAARPGGRTSATLAKILDATLAELTESGYAALSFDRVAHRAGVNRSSLYRRWPDVEALVLDVVLVTADQDVPHLDAGSARADLSALMHAVVANLADPRSLALLRLAAVEAGSAGAVGRIIREFWDARLQGAAALIVRGQQRGELRQQMDPVRAVETLIGPVFLRLLVTGVPVTHDDVDELLLDWLAFAAPA